MDNRARFQNALAGNRVTAIAGLAARPVLDHAGQPLVIAGNNALVARLRLPDGRDVAFRIVAPAGKAHDWPVRYTALAGFVEERATDRIPGGIEVVREPFAPAEGIAIQGTGPGMGLLMEWIAGPTLLQAVDRAARARNATVLRALSAAFLRCWNDLQGWEFVHGDITASNLLVRPNGHLACVDLDGASWAGAPLAAAGEGSPGYRHPAHSRDADERDLFAALVIHVSLAVLADVPSLRDAYGERAETLDGALLFTAWDLAHASRSRVFDHVRRSVAGATRLQVEALIAACDGGIDTVAEALGGIPGMRVPASLVAAQERETAGWDVAPVVERLRAHYGQTWGGSDNAATGAPVLPVTPSIRPPSTSAWSTWTVPDAPPPPTLTAADIDELKRALARNDEADVFRIWSRIGQDPLASMFAAQVETLLAASYDRRIVEEARQRDDEAVIALGAEAETRRLPLGPRARTALRQARERVDVRSRLERALAGDDREELADLAVSGRLVVLGDTDRPTLLRVIQAIEWPVLQRAIESDDDVLIDAAFDDEVFGTEGNVSPEIRTRVELARARIAWTREVRAALAQRKPTELHALFLDPPPGAAEQLGVAERRRIRRIIEQAQALQDLAEVLQTEDEPRIIAALNRVERVSARISDRATWSAIQRVVERVSLVDDLLEAAQQDPLDYGRLAQLLPAVRALGIDRDARLGESGLVHRLEEELVRMAHVRRIQAAIARDNDIAIVTAAVPDPRNALELLSREERDRVAAAIRARRKAARALHARGAEPDR